MKAGLPAGRQEWRPSRIHLSLLFFGIYAIIKCMKKALKIPTIDVKKYGGKQVAVVRGKIVASGGDTKEVLSLVKKRLPKAKWTDILLVSVPKGLTVVYKI